MQKFLRNFDVNAGGVGKIAFWPTEKSASQTPTAKNLCSSAAVVRVNNGALAGEYAVLSTTLVVVEV